jgi:hypothetical protein
VIFLVSLAFKFYRLRTRGSAPLAVDEIPPPADDRPSHNN